MAVDILKALAKLDRPPSGHNWARFVHDNQPSTTRAILQFVGGIPRFTYTPALVAIRDVFLYGIGLDTALSIVARSGAPSGKQQNREVVEAFFAYNAVRQYPVGTCVEFERQWFSISRTILVPVAPLVVFREDGQFIPTFVCGWSELALNDGQRRLLMSVVEDAFLSLTDYQNSPAEFVFLPKAEVDGKTMRLPEIWHRGDYRLLSPTELNGCVELYLDSREEVRGILLSRRAADERRRTQEEPERSKGDEDADLFTLRATDKK